MEPSNSAVLERSRHTDISLQTLYDAIFSLKFAAHLSDDGDSRGSLLIPRIGGNLLRCGAADEGTDAGVAFVPCFVCVGSERVERHVM